MAISMNELKKPQSITDTITLPTSITQKERYKRIQNEFDKRGLGSLHKLTRKRIDALLDEAETMLALEDGDPAA